MNKWPPIASALVLFALLGGAVLYYTHGGAAPTPPATTTLTDAATSTDFALAPGFVTASTSAENPATGPLKPPRQAPAGQREFRSPQYRFSVLYPDDLSAQSYDEGEGAATVVFQNTAEAKGVQIFVVPYTAYQVSMQRFRGDEPSGVMQSPRAVTIDGAAATSFYGQDLIEAETLYFVCIGEPVHEEGPAAGQEADLPLRRRPRQLAFKF